MLAFNSLQSDFCACQPIEQACGKLPLSGGQVLNLFFKIRVVIVCFLRVFRAEQQLIGRCFEYIAQLHQHVNAQHGSRTFNVGQIFVTQSRHFIDLPLLESQFFSSCGNAFADFFVINVQADPPFVFIIIHLHLL